MRTTIWGLVLLVLAGLATASAQLAERSGLEGRPEASPSHSDATETRSLQRQSPSRSAALAHVVDGAATLYNRPDSSAPVAQLPVRTPLRRLDCTDRWCHVRTDAGRTGYVPTKALSSVWLRVSKAKRRLYVYRGPRLVDTHKIDVGYNTFADKKQRGSESRRDHWRTPEGVFYVVARQPRSQFYKALVLNYPTIADAKRGREQDLISEQEYNDIVQAQQQRRMPPMGTELGGWIEIHGDGTGSSTNWTQGCVAVHNRVMNELWTEVEVGTPVLIE